MRSDPIERVDAEIEPILGRTMRSPILDVAIFEIGTVGVGRTKTDPHLMPRNRDHTYSRELSEVAHNSDTTPSWSHRR